MIKTNLRNTQGAHLFFNLQILFLRNRLNNLLWSFLFKLKYFDFLENRMNSTYYLLYSILQLGYFISVIGSALERQYIVCWTKTAANRTWPHVLRMALAAETLIRRPWCLLFSVEIWYNYRLQVTIFDWNRLAIVNVIFTLLRGNFNRLSLFPMETRIFFYIWLLCRCH